MMADSLRGVIFSASPTGQPDALAVWNTAMGSISPDAFQRPPNMPGGMSTAEGALGKERLILQVQVGRADIIISPAAPPPDNGVDLPPEQIIDLNDALRKLEEITQKVIVMLPVVTRVAVIVELSEAHDSAATVNGVLSQLTGGTWFPSNGLDCLYQVNVRKKFLATGEYEMNRVVTWSAGALHLVQQNVDLRLRTAMPSVSRSFPIVNLKIDLNSATNADISGKASTMLSEIIDELSPIIIDFRNRLGEQ